MQVSSVNSPAFTSAIPTRVILDGKEQANPEIIQKGCKALIDLLAGPIKNNPQKQNIARRFAIVDRDYDYAKALNGYTGRVYEYGKAIKKTASNFFRYMNIYGKDFLITGPQAEGLAKTGKQLGIAKAFAKSKGIKEGEATFEIQQAKIAYGDLINKLANNRAIRVREGYDSATKQNLGRETLMNIYLKTIKNSGKKDIKMEVESIEFKPYGK